MDDSVHYVRRESIAGNLSFTKVFICFVTKRVTLKYTNEQGNIVEIQYRRRTEQHSHSKLNVYINLHCDTLMIHSDGYVDSNAFQQNH